MRLTDITMEQWVCVPLKAATKIEAIETLIDQLASHGNVIEAADMKAAVLAREQTRTTGIGHGVAIPHGKCESCKQLCLAIGKLETPIDFGSVDGRPVELIFLLGSPLSQTGPHIQALAGISRMLTDPEFRRAIKSASTGPQLYQLIVDYQAKLPG